MTKYCMDLINEQVKEGHTVSLLWPGTVINWNGRVTIKRRAAYQIERNEKCGSFELINPLPVPLLDGIENVPAFTRNTSIAVFEDFFESVDADVIHIHTLMGLPLEAVQAAKKLDIRIVFTSHDYFGLCPKGAFFHNGKVCSDYHECLSCETCNKGALSLHKIQVLQSPIYRILKDSLFISNIRKNHRTSKGTLEEKSDGVCLQNKENARKYLALREYYLKMLKLCDVLHFNSCLTKQLYAQFMDVSLTGKVISISHGSITDCRRLKNIHNPVHFSYLGPCEDKRKGFSILKQAFDKIYLKNKGKFILNIYGLCSAEAPYLKKNASYQYAELVTVFEDTDMLIVPSVWLETFGFTVLEALSFGVPVLISTHVGAQDIIRNGITGQICNPTVDDFADRIESVLRNPQMLSDMNRCITHGTQIKTMDEHSREIIEKCYN